MRAVIRSALVALIVGAPLATLSSAPAVLAQNNQADQAEAALPQSALTDKQVENVLAAKPEIDAIIAKLPQTGDRPDPKIMARLDAAAKKHGFANYADYDAVTGNIGLVMEGFDPESNKYVGAETVLKKQIAEVQADKAMTAAAKKDTLAELNDELKAVQPLQFPANIEVVTKYYDKLSAAVSTNQ